MSPRLAVLTKEPGLHPVKSVNTQTGLIKFRQLALRGDEFAL
jgi:hypothetical protein